MIQEAVSGLILRTHAGYAQDVLLSALCPSGGVPAALAAAAREDWAAVLAAAPAAVPELGWQRARLRSVVPLKRTI